MPSIEVWDHGDFVGAGIQKTGTEADSECKGFVCGSS